MCLYNLCYWRQILRKFGIYKKISVKQNSINMVRLPCICQNQNIWKATDAPQHLWCILFTIYDVFYSRYMMYFIHSIWYTSFTIYDIFHSQYMIYFIHNICYISFTIYYVFYSQYDISFTILWIKYVINFAVHLLLLYMFWTTVLVLVITCLAVPQLFVYTRKQTGLKNLIDAVFQIFFSILLWDEPADFLTKSSVACGLWIHFVHQSSWLSARLILLLHPHYMLQANLRSH